MTAIGFFIIALQQAWRRCEVIGALKETPTGDLMQGAMVVVGTLSLIGGIAKVLWILMP